MRLWLVLLLVLAAGAQESIQIPTILTYRQELGLSEQQVAAIKKGVEDFRLQALPLSEKIKAAKAQLNSELAAHAELPKVKQSVSAYYEALGALAYADLAWGRKLEGMLTPEQLKSWRALQARSKAQRP